MRLGDTERAVHAKMRTSSIKHWLMDETVVGPLVDRVTGLQATQAAGTGMGIISACAGKARRFLGVSLFQEAAANAYFNTQMRGNSTVSVLLRLTATPSATMVFLTLGGSSELSTNNEIITVGCSSGGGLFIRWEHSAGTDVQIATFPYVLPLYKWTSLHVRRSAVTGDGPAGTCTMELFVNGQSMTFTTANTGLTNTSDGSLSTWKVGGSASGELCSGVDVAGAYAWAEALQEEEIWEDVRRLYLLPFFSRVDMKLDLETQSAGVMQDMTDVQGMDFVEKVEITDEIDQPCTTANITLLREQEGLSLASLKTDTKLNLTDAFNPLSYSPFLNPSRLVEVWAARVPLGIRASGRDWSSAFRGVVDEIDESSDEGVVLHCRDLGGLLVDAFIEEIIVYGDTAGLPVQAEMQWILNDNDNLQTNNSLQTGGGGDATHETNNNVTNNPPGITDMSPRLGSYAPITLFTPVSPGWSVKKWKQRREGIMPAGRTLAGQIGWEWRYRFDQNPEQNQWRLTFYNPQRERKDEDVIITLDDVLEITQFSRSALGIRDVVRVIYPSSETLAPTVPTSIDGVSLAAAGYTVTTGWNNVDGEGNRMTAYIEIASGTALAFYGRRWFCEFAEASSSQIDTINEAALMAFGALRDLEEAQLDKGVRIPCMWEAELNDMVKFAPNAFLFTAPQRLALRQVTHTFADQATTSLQLRGKPSVGVKRWLRLETRAGNARPGVVRPQDANADEQQGSLLQSMRNLLDRTGAFRGGKFLQVRNPEFQGFANGLRQPPDGWSVRFSTWNTDMVASTGLQLSGGKAVQWLTAFGRLVSNPVPISGSRFIPYSFEAKWQRATLNSGVTNASTTASQPRSQQGPGLTTTLTAAALNTVTLTVPAAAFNNPSSVGGMVQVDDTTNPTNSGLWTINSVTSTTVCQLIRPFGAAINNTGGTVSVDIKSVTTFNAPASIFSLNTVGGHIRITSGPDSNFFHYIGGVPTGSAVRISRLGGGNFTNSGAISWEAPCSLAMDIEFYDVNNAQVGLYTVAPNDQASPSFGADSLNNEINTWFSSRADGVAPADDSSARFLRMVLRPVGAFAVLTVDDVSAYKTGLDLRTYNTSNPVGYDFAAGGVGWYPVQYPQTGYPSTLGVSLQRWDYGIGSFGTASSGVASFGRAIAGDVALPAWSGWGFYAREDGTYTVTAITVVGSTGVNKLSGMRFVLNASYGNNGLGSVTVNTGGTVAAISSQFTLQLLTTFGVPRLSELSANTSTDFGAIITLTSRVRMVRGDRLTVEIYRQDNTISQPTSNGAGSPLALVTPPGDLSLFVVKQEITE